MKKLILFICSLATVAAMQAQVIHVPGDYPTIQAAVDAAGYGDTVLVAPGRYEENITIQGNQKAITLAGNFIFSGDTNDIKNTIIDAGHASNPNYGMGIYLSHIDTVLMPKITGFTITDGTGFYNTYGGGIMSAYTLPVIEHNIIENCAITGTQPNGGGIRVNQGVWDTNKVCLVRYNIIRNCTINAASNSSYGGGAGISLGAINAIVEGNTITGNHIAGNGNMRVEGGAIVYANVNPFFNLIHGVIRNNIITNNSVEGDEAFGGGIVYFDDNASGHVIIEGNTITGNRATTLTSNGAALGGGILLENIASGSVISGNDISGNQATATYPGAIYYGGGLHLNNYNLAFGPEYYILMADNRIVGNTAKRGGGINCQRAAIRVVNNILDANQAETFAGGVYLIGENNTVCSFINNTFVENTVTGAGGQGGSMYIVNAPAVLMMNDIFYENEAPVAKELQIFNSTVQVSYCDIDVAQISGPWTGDGNFLADPSFIDEFRHICETSSCEDMGADSVLFSGTWYHAPSADFEGTPRPWHLGIDIGADECDIITRITEGKNDKNLTTIQCYPNPTPGIVDLHFTIYNLESVILKVFNAQGQEVAVVLDQKLPAGEHTVRWDAGRLPAGIYYYRLTILQASPSGQANDYRLTTGKIVKY